MYGFVEVEEIVFGEKSAIVVDPGEESLKVEFGNVRRLLIPFNEISRIDEVEKEGSGKVFAISGSTDKTGSAPAILPPQDPAKS